MTWLGIGLKFGSTVKKFAQLGSVSGAASSVLPLGPASVQGSAVIVAMAKWLIFHTNSSSRLRSEKIPRKFPRGRG